MDRQIAVWLLCLFLLSGRNWWRCGDSGFPERLCVVIGMMTDRAGVLFVQVDGATLWATCDVSSYLYATRWACRSLVADLVPAFRAFDDGHILLLRC